MAFIKNTEREQLIKKVNRSYAVKKLLLLIDMVGWLTFAILTIVSWVNVDYKEGGDQAWAWFNGKELTGLGIGMIVFAIIVMLLGIVSVVLIFTIRSPKAIKKDIKKLESSAISGKKIDRSKTAGEIMRERRTPEKYKGKKK